MVTALAASIQTILWDVCARSADDISDPVRPFVAMAAYLTLEYREFDFSLKCAWRVGAGGPPFYFSLNVT
jgi:hypothetical protein